MESIEWAYDDIGEITSKGQLNNMADFLAHKQLDLVINLPMRHGGARRVSSFSTHGKLFQVTQLWYLCIFRFHCCSVWWQTWFSLGQLSSHIKDARCFTTHFYIVYFSMFAVKIKFSNILKNVVSMQVTEPDAWLLITQCH